MVEWSELKQTRGRLEMKTAWRLLEQLMMEAIGLYTSMGAVGWGKRREGQGIPRWQSRGLVISVRHGLRTSAVFSKSVLALLSQSVTHSAKISNTNNTPQQDTRLQDTYKHGQDTCNVMGDTDTSRVCLVAQLCATLCNPMDCSLPGSSVHRILQARILEWVAMPSSGGSSPPKDQTQVSCIAGEFFTVWATILLCNSHPGWGPPNFIAHSNSYSIVIV